MITFVASVTTADGSSGTSLDCGTTLNVQAGDILVGIASWRGATAGALVLSQNDGSSNVMELLAEYIGVSNGIRLGYVLVAEADAAATFRMAQGNARDYRIFTVLQFRPDADETISLDFGTIGAGGLSGTNPVGDSWDSSGDDEVIIAAISTYYNQTPDAMYIGSDLADGSVSSADYLWSWYKIYDAPQIGKTASVTLGGNTDWVIETIGIKSTGGGGGGLSVTYTAPDADSGDVPVDSSDYTSGDTVTVVDNPGGLARAGFILDGWVFSDSLESTIDAAELDETNTGVRSGHSLTDVVETIMVTEAWIASVNGGSRVLSDRNFLSGANLIFQVNDFTVRDCRFNGSAQPVGQDYSNIMLEYCEMDGALIMSGDATAIGVGNYWTIRRCHAHRWPRILMTAVSNLLLEENYFHDIYCDGAGAHIENIYIAGGEHLSFIRNKLLSNAIGPGSGSQISASLAIYNEDWSDFTPLDYVLVQDNYFGSDGGFAMYGGAVVSKTHPYAKHMTVSGNIFGRDYQRHCGLYGAATAYDNSEPTNSWTNNVWGPEGPHFVLGDPAEGVTVDAPTPS